jgi:response regulator of citrate/malate metabolism
MRIVKTHPEASINFTEHAQILCQILNEHMKMYPTTTFKELAELCQMSQTNVRRYYYGVQHYIHRGTSYTQIREGASVAI